MEFQIRDRTVYTCGDESVLRPAPHRTPQRDILSYAIKEEGIRYCEAKRLTGASSPNVCKVLRRLCIKGALERVKRGHYAPTKTAEAVLQRDTTMPEQLAAYFSSRGKGYKACTKELESLGITESYAYRLARRGTLKLASPGMFGPGQNLKAAMKRFSRENGRGRINGGSSVNLGQERRLSPKATPRMR